MSKSIENIERQIVPDEDPDLSYLQQDYSDSPADEARRYRMQDARRLAAYERGDWHMVGVRAVAEVIVNGVSMTITSPGLWGVESDSEDSYFSEIYADELDNLADMLTELDFGASEIFELAPELTPNSVDE